MVDAAMGSQATLASVLARAQALLPTAAAAAAANPYRAMTPNPNLAPSVPAIGPMSSSLYGLSPEQIHMLEQAIASAASAAQLQAEAEAALEEEEEEDEEEEERGKKEEDEPGKEDGG
ncbi:hypothetical protein B0F90DRAFT_1341763 [Multifurca ochricompacta]|uniref:Uncharacterized protein n=1 Tax=Multifurca ochricompacta TaxID=376703 RepID=A0AAD4LZP3_9AGAM|nr:hypothetical protein B0F90DRAFT_1341763 [Multifurca ochricompacta]